MKAKSGSIAIVALAALVPAFAGAACGATRIDTQAQVSRLVTYREEGGIGGPRPSLAVSTGGKAELRVGGCHAEYTVGEALWRKLRGALQRADLGSIAGDYPPPGGAADMIIYLVRSEGHEVRIAPDPRYETVLVQIEPLLGALQKVVAQGRSKLPAGCLGGGA